MDDNSSFMIPISTCYGRRESYNYRDHSRNITLNDQCEQQFKLYEKRWSANILKAALHEEKPPLFLSGDHIRMKIAAGRIRIASSFTKEGHLLANEFRDLRALPLTGKAQQTMLRQLSEPHIDSLWMNCAKDYASVCSLSCLDNLCVLAARCNAEDPGADIGKFCEALVGLFDALQTEAVQYYEEQKEQFKDRLDAVIESGSNSWDALIDDVRNIFTQGWRKLGDEAHRLNIKTELAGIRLYGRDMYTYVCGNSETTCDICNALDGKHFAIDDAEEGVNLPPIHPNCRCTVDGYPPLPKLVDDFEIADAIDWDMLKRALDSILDRPKESLDNAVDVTSFMWKLLFSRSVQEYFGAYTTIEIAGKKYRIDRSTFSAVAVGPDGKLIVPENAKPYDERMLELMRRRDELPMRSAERKEIEAEIERIKAENKNNNNELLSVRPSNPYSYYILGGDVTEQLNDYMRQTEIDYAYMHDRYWVNNLLEFKGLVQNNGEMDLKNQPQWQHSAYIYDGELVNQDVLGNINYGYFGTFCNIPDVVLLAGAGYAQIRAGNSELAFWISFFDDPRDSHRVMQGIEIYGLWH